MLPLSTIAINADEIGKRTCQVLNELLNQSTPVRTLYVNLQIRDQEMKKGSDRLCVA